MESLIFALFYIYIVANTCPLTEEVLLARSRFVCAGGKYHIGCSDRAGIYVLNIEFVTIELAPEDLAASCEGAFGCIVTISVDDDTVVNENMLKLYKRIMENCHGKRECRGTIPDINSVTWHPNVTHDSCGLFGEVEYLNDVHIDGVCQDPWYTDGSIHLYPPVRLQ